MNLSLTPETQKLIQERMRRDGFASADEWLRAALVRLDDADELDEQELSAIERSEQQFREGKDLDWKQVSAEMRKEFLGQ